MFGTDCPYRKVFLMTAPILVFTIEFTEDVMYLAVGDTFEHEHIFFARTYAIPYDLAGPWVVGIENGLLELAQWATTPPNVNLPEWEKPKKVRAAEYDGDIIQIIWGSDQNGIEVTEVLMIALEAPEIRETLESIHQAVSDVIQEIGPLLVENP